MLVSKAAITPSKYPPHPLLSLNLDHLHLLFLLPFFHSRKRQLQTPGDEREQVSRLLPHGRAVFPGGEADIELLDQHGNDEAQFAQCELFADAAVAALAEGLEGALVLDQFGTAVPALWGEGLGVDVAAFGCQRVSGRTKGLEK